MFYTQKKSYIKKIIVDYVNNILFFIRLHDCTRL